MKKTAFIVLVTLAAMVSSGLAAPSWSWSTGTFSNVTPGSSVSDNLNLAITSSTPAGVTGFDLILESSNAPSGDFTITADTAPSGWTPAGVLGTETLTTANSDHTGFVQNPDNLGFAAPTREPASNYPSPAGALLDTLTIQVAPGTPAGTYTFETTPTYAEAGGMQRFSDITNAGDSASPYHMTPATFTITVVPEPATMSLMGLSALGSLGLNILRRKRRA